MRHERNIKAKRAVQLDLVDLLPQVKNQLLPPEQRFRKMLKHRGNGCITFTGAEDFRNGGYGRFRVGDRVWKAHSYAWFLWFGKECEDLLIRHTCHNPLCCNVLHMKGGNHAQNSADMVEAGRQGKKLKKEQVQLVVKLYHERGFGTKHLAQQFGVKEAAIVALLSGRTWANETGIQYQPKKPHQRKLIRGKEAA